MSDLLGGLFLYGIMLLIIGGVALENQD